MNGSKIAWNCGKYRDFQDFKNAQHNWAVAGLIIFLLGIFAQAYVLYAVLSLI